jgi:hypothetical protein
MGKSRACKIPSHPMVNPQMVIGFAIDSFNAIIKATRVKFLIVFLKSKFSLD